MRKREIDPNSRDYEFSEIEPDERFVQTAKEFWVTIGTFCVFTVLMILNLYMDSVRYRFKGVTLHPNGRVRRRWRSPELWL